MSFLAPLGLLALLTLPIILLLHLMRERRRRVVVPSLLLWQMLPQRQEAQRRRRLPLTLLLLLHLLAALLLALALAQPQVLLDLFGREQHVALIIDTSTSMAAGDRFARAQQRAAALIGGLGGRDSLVLISAGSQAQLIGRADATNAASLQLALEDLRPGGTGSDLDGALILAESALHGLNDARIVIVTDAAIPDLADEYAGRGGNIPLTWLAVAQPLDNRAVVTLATRRGSGGSLQIYTRAVNYGNDTLRTTLRLYGNDELIDTRIVTFRPRSEVELTWNLPPGPQLLRVELDGRDELSLDDRAELRIAGTRPLQVALVAFDPAPLDRALQALPGVQVQVIAPESYRPSGTVDLTVFNGVLPDSWPEGAVLVVNPPPGAALLQVGGRLAEPAEAAVRATAGVPLFDGINLASVDFGRVAELDIPEWATVLLRRGEQPLVVRGRLDRSEIAVWSFDLSQGNLANRLAFPLLTARTVRDLLPDEPPTAVLLGTALTISVDPRADAISLRDPAGNEQNLELRDGRVAAPPLREVGVYRLEERRDGQILYAVDVPVNAGTPQESELTPQALPPDRPPPPSQVGDVSEDGRRIWPWLVVVALVVMMGEWLYVHGARRPGVGR